MKVFCLKKRGLVEEMIKWGDKDNWNSFEHYLHRKGGGIQKEKRDLRKKELQDFFFSREEDLATFFVIYTIRSELRTKG